MKDLMAAKAGIVPPGHLTAYSTPPRYTAGRRPAARQSPPRAGLGTGDDGEDGQPPHQQIDGAGEPAGDLQPGHGEHHAHHAHGPHRQQGLVPQTAAAPPSHRRIAPGDKQIDRAVVVFPQARRPATDVLTQW